MLKQAASVVLASLKVSTYRQKVRLDLSLAAASLDDLFDHPASHPHEIFTSLSVSR